MKFSNEKAITCEWCTNIPRLCFEEKKKKQKEGLVPTNFFYYGCYVHRKQLEELAEKKHGEIIMVTDKLRQEGTDE